VHVVASRLEEASAQVSSRPFPEVTMHKITRVAEGC